MRALCRLLAALTTSNVFGLCVCPGTVITHSRLIVDYKVFWPRTCYMYWSVNRQHMRWHVGSDSKNKRVVFFLHRLTGTFTVSTKLHNTQVLHLPLIILLTTFLPVVSLVLTDTLSTLLSVACSALQENSTTSTAVDELPCQVPKITLWHRVQCNWQRCLARNSNQTDSILSRAVRAVTPLILYLFIFTWEASKTRSVATSLAADRCTALRRALHWVPLTQEQPCRL